MSNIKLQGTRIGYVLDSLIPYDDINRSIYHSLKRDIYDGLSEKDLVKLKFLIILYDYEFFGNDIYHEEQNLIHLSNVYIDYLGNGWEGKPYYKEVIWI